MSLVERKKISHQPLYLQIKEVLKEQILKGDFPPYERMPSESEMMAKFKVSRITVRQALKDLHSEGLIFTAQGKGTFASKPKAMQEVEYLEGFEEAMNPKGYETSARLISLKEINPGQSVKEQLGLSQKEKAVEIVRVRYLNREPVSVDTSYFPVRIGHKLFPKNLEKDIFPLLENDLGIALGKARISLEARAADAAIALHLGIEVGSPIMWVERLTHDRDENPIDYEYLAFRGDAYKYRFTIDRTLP